MPNPPAWLAAMLARPIRCLLTGHPCGTDTVMVGAPPDCSSCETYSLLALVETLAGALIAANEWAARYPLGPTGDRSLDQRAADEVYRQASAALAAYARGPIAEGKTGPAIRFTGPTSGA
jgi:hypothetical protein